MLMSSERLRAAAKEPSVEQLARENDRDAWAERSNVGTPAFTHLVEVSPETTPAKRATKPAKGETKPAKRETKPAAGDVAQAVLVGIDLIHVHPKNRRPEAEAVQELAASIEANELQQPILLRVAPEHWGLPAGHFQIVWGERRYLATKQLGREAIKAWIRDDLDDQQTLLRMAEENAKRQDLNPIEKARLLETLSQPIDKGGAGLTREAAAVHVGLESGSAASNLVRLLKLPKLWQARVAAGELPESFARLLLPYCHAAKVMDEVNASWERAHKPNAPEHERDDWETRSELERELFHIFRDWTRPIDKGDEFYYDHDFSQQLGDYRYQGRYGPLFKLTPALDSELDVLTFEGVRTSYHEKPKTIRRATNWKLYDKHQIPAIKTHVNAKATKQAARAGREKPAPKKKLTPAQEQARKAENARQLQLRIDGWRNVWLKELLAEKVPEDKALRDRLLIALALHSIDFYGFRDAGRDAVVARAKANDAKSGDTYDALVQLGNKFHALHECADAVVQAALRYPDRDPRHPSVKFADIDEMALFTGIDLAAEWKRLQEKSKVDEDPRWEQFFQLFLSGQLDPLGDELGVFVAGSKGKDAKIKLLLTRDRHLSLPACIKPLGAKGKRKRTR